ncbi:hypothetical protein OSB04_022590 [Centaurea solstitialis]|uniref:Epoxide hydrolase n=1 Tax=Centaurea solstitialis TaxID=347529 RepID=A0AA38TET3_9ASTR|nr:hypothetical protein OSB04_022590 [Centaurea solstitialis]
MWKGYDPGDIEAELAKTSPEMVMKKFLAFRDPGKFYFLKGKGFGYAVALPHWLSQDLEYYGSQLQKTGITGAVNYYQAFHLSWVLTSAWQGAKVMVPTKFITGDLDLVYHLPGMKEYIHNAGFQRDVPLFEEVVVMEGVAHFINQEKPHETNNHILEFLNKF